jgi:predicted DNA-binding ribbon-helix-helix protein
LFYRAFYGKPVPTFPKCALAQKNDMSLVKRSFSLYGHRTSVALEAEFWAAIEAEAARAGRTLAATVAAIDADRGDRALASALRLAALAAAKRRP